MAVAADAAAKRWIDGADIFVGGDDSFADEAFYRAGGLIGLRRIAPFKQKFNGTTMPWSDVPEESVVLYGLHRNVDPAIILFDELGHLAFEKDTVVFFGSKQWPVCQKIVKFLQKRLPADKFFFIDTDLPVDTRLKTAGGIVYGDYAAMATAVHLWAFTAELVAACTRQGKMPGIWPSGAIPKYEVWEKKYEKIRFHDDFTIEPIEAGVLGRAVPGNPAGAGPGVPGLSRAGTEPPRDCWRPCRRTGPSTSWSSRTCWRARRTCRWSCRTGCWCSAASDGRRAAPTVEKGDGILWLGYLDWPGREVKRAIQQQNPRGGRQRPRARSDAAKNDSVVWVPAPWVVSRRGGRDPGLPAEGLPHQRDRAGHAAVGADRRSDAGKSTCQSRRKIVA